MTVGLGEDKLADAIERSPSSGTSKREGFPPVNVSLDLPLHGNEGKSHGRDAEPAEGQNVVEVPKPVAA